MYGQSGGFFTHITQADIKGAIQRAQMTPSQSVALMALPQQGMVQGLLQQQRQPGSMYDKATGTVTPLVTTEGRLQIEPVLMDPPRAITKAEHEAMVLKSELKQRKHTRRERQKVKEDAKMEIAVTQGIDPTMVSEAYVEQVVEQVAPIASTIGDTTVQPPLYAQYKTPILIAAAAIAALLVLRK
jgi:hypothetical protein